MRKYIYMPTPDEIKYWAEVNQAILNLLENITPVDTGQWLKFFIENIKYRDEREKWFRLENLAQVVLQAMAEVEEPEDSISFHNGECCHWLQYLLNQVKTHQKDMRIKNDL